MAHDRMRNAVYNRAIPAHFCRSGGLNLTAFGDATSLFNIDGSAIVAVNAEHEHTAAIFEGVVGGKANDTG